MAEAVKVKRRKRRIRELRTGLVLLVSSLLFTWLVVELVLFRWFLPYFPLKLHGYLDVGFRPLAQSSKQRAVPRDYIALLGDSYAQGCGDWLLSVPTGRNLPFHAAHLVHQRTGRDVVSFGAGGAGSARGLVAVPMASWEYINASPLFSLDLPADVVVYFYEGNDLNDNLRVMRTHFAPCHGIENAADRRLMAEFLSEVVLGRDRVHRAAMSFRVVDNLLLTRALANLLTGSGGRFVPEPVIAGPTNRAVVGGNEVALPEALQGPALELTEGELGLALELVEGALAFLRGRLPCAGMGVVYVPSPLSCYELASPRVSIQTYENRGDVYPVAMVRERSDLICSRVQEIAVGAGYRFVDARPFIWRVSAGRLVHGPHDWKHFNRDGYTALTDAILELLGERPRGGSVESKAQGAEGG